MSKQAVTFYSQGCKLMGDFYRPDDLGDGETRAGILLCHGYTGVKDLYLPDNAAVLVAEGYVVLAFDYKGWGESEGPKSHLNPHGPCRRCASRAHLSRPATGGRRGSPWRVRHELWRRHGGVARRSR